MESAVSSSMSRSFKLHIMRPKAFAVWILEEVNGVVVPIWIPRVVDGREGD